jgi:hypothetical protein
MFWQAILPKQVCRQDHAGMKLWSGKERTFRRLHTRFSEVSVGISVALIVIELWPERSPIAAKSVDE